MNFVGFIGQLRALFILSIILLSPIFTFCQVRPPIKPTIYEEPGRPQTRFDSVICAIPNIIYIDFMEGFNDSVYIFRNSECVDAIFLNTNESIGLAGGTIFGFNNDDNIYITLLFKKSGLIIRDKLKLNYKLLQIRNLGRWGFYYSNHFSILE